LDGLTQRAARGVAAFAAIFFAAAIALFLFFTLWTLGQPALDMWGFRPAQTLAPVPYMLSEGAWIANVLPIFGEPWIFSQEFPLYQWLVAAIVGITGLPLAGAGRIVSAAFTLACVWPIYLIASTLDALNRTRTTLFVSALWLLAPPVLFWGRSTLIESTVVFLSLAWLAYYIRFLRDGRPAHFLLCVLFGVLAASIKVTAFAGFVMGGFFFTLYFMLTTRHELLRHAGRLVAALACVVVPVVALIAWSGWTSAAWKLNPLASMLLLSSMPGWYFGNLADRLGDQLWTWAIAERALPNVFGSAWPMLATAVVVVAIFMYRLRIVLLLAVCFLTGFLVFPRLFMENIYYEVENLIFLVAMVGVVAAALCATRWWIVGCLLIVATAGLQLWTLTTGTYGHQFFDDLRQHPYYLAGVRVKEATQPDSVVVVFGTGWGSDVPLISERRGIVVANWFPNQVLDDILFDQRQKWLGGRTVGAVVDCNVFAGQTITEPLLSIRDRLLAEMTSDVEIVSGPVGNGSVDNPTCSIKFAIPPPG
jgi:hypothetical protein